MCLQTLYFRGVEPDDEAPEVQWVGLHGGNPALPSFPTVLLDDPPRGDAESWNKSA